MLASVSVNVVARTVITSLRIILLGCLRVCQNFGGDVCYWFVILVGFNDRNGDYSPYKYFGAGNGGQIRDIFDRVSGASDWPA